MLANFNRQSTRGNFFPEIVKKILDLFYGHEQLHPEILHLGAKCPMKLIIKQIGPYDKKIFFFSM